MTPGERFVVTRELRSEAGVIADTGDAGTVLATLEKANMAWVELDRPRIPNYSECYIGNENLKAEL